MAPLTIIAATDAIQQARRTQKNCNESLVYIQVIEERERARDEEGSKDKTRERREKETYQCLCSRSQSESSEESKDCCTTKKAACCKETPEGVDSAFIDECEDDHCCGHALKGEREQCV